MFTHATVYYGTHDCGLLLQGNLSNPTPPYGSTNYSALVFPAPVAYPFYSASNDGICNTYLPNDSTLNRRAANLKSNQSEPALRLCHTLSTAGALPCLVHRVCCESCSQTLSLWRHNAPRVFEATTH